MKRNLYLDLLIISFSSIFLLGLTLAQIKIPGLTFFMGLLVSFIFPGYTLTSGLFIAPGLSWVERLILILGLNLAVTIFGGLLLNTTSWGLRPESWSVFFAIVNLLGSVIAFVRRGRNNLMKSHELEVGFSWPTRNHLPIFGVALIIIALSLSFAYFIATFEPRTDIVQLWLLPDNSEEIQNIKVGVLIYNDAPREYFLWVERGGYTIQEWPHLILKPGQKWEAVIALDSNLPGSGPIEAKLYKLDELSVAYRSTSFWIDDLDVSLTK